MAWIVFMEHASEPFLAATAGFDPAAPGPPSKSPRTAQHTTQITLSESDGATPRDGRRKDGAGAATRAKDARWLW